MPLSETQISSLLELITSGSPDRLDCDGCFDRIAEFAEAELANREVPAALQAVQIHLQQCACCQAEYNALLQGLQEIEETAG